MGLFDAVDISGSALSAERLRMDVTAENLANANTTRGVNGGAYRRKVVVLEQQAGGGQGSFGNQLASAMSRGGAAEPGGVQVRAIAEDTTPNRRVYDPGHPDADPQGYVTLPNVNSVTEMTDMITETRSYQANTQALQMAKSLYTKTLEVLR